MSRYIAVSLLLCLVAGGCGRLRNRPLVTPPPLDAADPQAVVTTPPSPVTPPYVTAAEAFFGALSKDETGEAYALLTDHYRSLISQQAFADMLVDVRIKDFQVVASAGSANVGYVVLSLRLAKPVAAGPPIAGYSLLLKKARDADTWQVALLQAEEKLAGKYQDLLIIPSAKGQSYIVTYTDEQGKQSRTELQEP